MQAKQNRAKKIGGNKIGGWSVRTKPSHETDAESIYPALSEKEDVGLLGDSD